MFTLTTVTIARRTQIVSRWLTAAGIAAALVLLIGVGISAWVELLFPAWKLHGDAFVRYEGWQRGSTRSALAAGDGHRLGRRAGPAERRTVRIPSARRSLVARGG